MSCFLVPAAEAVVVSLIEHRQRLTGTDSPSAPANGRISWRTKLSWLSTMLWGGAILLALEHLWHGEISLSFPYLTAVATGETGGMLLEMATVGVAMTALVTLAWGVMVVLVERVPRLKARFQS